MCKINIHAYSVLHLGNQPLCNKTTVKNAISKHKSTQNTAFYTGKHGILQTKVSHFKAQNTVFQALICHISHNKGCI